MESKEARRVVPEWLQPLLSTLFFTTCFKHKDTPRSERNMFCLDCITDAFCFFCRSLKHKDHHVIQIRRSSYHDVVRVSEIQSMLDVNGVQTYVINSARVVFLNQRPQITRSGISNNGGGNNNKGLLQHSCQVCGRSLLEPFRFCSLGCKFIGPRKIENHARFRIINHKSLEERRSSPNDAKKEEQKRESEFFEKRQEAALKIVSPTAPNFSFRRRSRKGIPFRAPF